MNDLQRLWQVDYFDIGWFRAPSLRKSLTSDREGKYDSTDYEESTIFSTTREISESYNNRAEYDEGRSQNEGVLASQEERLLDAVTTPGGMRLQPSRETVQNFLTGAVNLDAERLGHALESKLRAHSWQVCSLFIFTNLEGNTNV